MNGFAEDDLAAKIKKNWLLWCGNAIMLLCFSILFSPRAYAAEKDVIDDVYRVLEQDYINELSQREITVKGLEALSALDSSLRVSPGSGKLFLYYGRRMVKSFILPPEHAESSKWADVSRQVIAAAVDVSPKAEIVDFEIPDRFAGKVFNGLDGYSHYYAEFSGDSVQGMSDARPVLRRNFAIRQLEDVMLIKILSFQPDVSDDVKKAIDQCSGCSGLVLDLRGNHGGVLDEALKMADFFLDEGIIAYTTGKENQTPHFYTAGAGDIFQNKPIVVLIDGFTASAAEILAAALSEQNRAILIGTETYGKGTVQDVKHIGKSGKLALTTAYFYTPSGFKIDKAGLKPAICTGGLKSIDDLEDASCQKEDRFNQEVDVQAAARYINNEL